MAEVGCLKDGHFQNLQVEGNTILGGSIFNKLTYTSAELGTNAAGWADSPATVNVSEHNGIVETIVFLDLHAATCDAGGSAKDVISKAGAGYFMQLQKEINGYIFHVSMTCVETPTGSIDEDIDLVTNTNSINGSAAFDGAGTPKILITAGASWTIGTSIGADLAIGTSTAGLDNHYVYLAGGNDGGTSGNPYTAGKFIIKFLGVVSKPDGSVF
tara:strand:+ start:297 stop:938 length:642 start_codon:yes stop_codon:yes gene_type:complete